RRTKCRDRSLSISTERWRDANNSSDGRRYRSESLNGERRQEVPVSSNYHFRYHTNNIKRILLTRKYRDTNIYNDLGIRVTGGKKLWNGDLGAFISAINRNRSKELLGEIKEGDQVLEWNGILLTGKTFEEVERIIGASKGEIEVVIKSTTSERPTRQILKNLNYSRDSVGNDSRSRKNYDETSDYQKEAPPVPVHRCIDGRASPEFDYYPPTAQFIQNFPSRVVANETNANYHELTSLGYLNIALSYDASISTLFITVLSAKGLTYRQYYNTTFYPNPFVKIYLLPGRKVSNKRRTKFVPNSIDPIWNQTIEYIIYPRELYGHYLEFTVWDYDKINENNSLGQVVISLSEPYILNGVARWYPLQAMHQNFVVSGFPGLQFQTVIPSKNTFQSVQQYNPGTSI
ncbi:unnamed protein product, partial [Dracunculus medinensis]|uniref:C2 domain-containing protein n=1 Tax=Dracunculus medinensis TaxID=318479 RepID=A0A0N4UES1_DRAME